jgi:uncharacterized membrane protein YfcA
VGVLSGFFGVGGGFLITGGLLVFGVPPIFAVGTGLALVMGTSLISTLRHRRAGNVDLKLGLLLLGSALPAVFLAERLNAALETEGLAGPVISYMYVVMLNALAGFIIFDTWRSRRAASGADRVSTQRLIHRVQTLRIWPHSIRLPWVARALSTYVALPAAGIPRISVFVPLAVGSSIGFLSGLLGAGGGFMVVPVLIFVLGVPTRLAIGTGLLQTVATGSLGTFLYARSGHVDLVMAVIMLVTASVGSRLGVAANQVVSPGRIRLLFALTLIAGALAVAMKLVADLSPDLEYLNTEAAVVLLGAAGAICLVVAALVVQEMREGSAQGR